MIKFDKEIGLTPKEKEMIARVVETTGKIYNDSGELHPTFFITNSKIDQMNLISGTFQDDDKKRAFVGTVKRMIVEMKADGCLSVMDSWTLPSESAQDFMKNRDKYPTVSDHPDAYDCVFFMYENRLGTWVVSCKSNPKAKTVDLENLEFKRADGMQGLMSNFIHIKEILQ